MLDSIVLIAMPIYNADGNERFGPQAVNRTEQNGPEMVGQRPNAQRLDLNRDYMKAEAPETRASLAAFEKWDPDVFVDLHTTDGSFHGYALTYSPSLNPAARDAGAYTRDSLLPELRARMLARAATLVFDYGNFDTQYEERDISDTVKSGWYTYDHRPRFGTNYFGLRQRSLHSERGVLARPVRAARKVHVLCSLASYSRSWPSEARGFARSRMRPMRSSRAEILPRQSRSARS